MVCDGVPRMMLVMPYSCHRVMGEKLEYTSQSPTKSTSLLPALA